MTKKIEPLVGMFGGIALTCPVIAYVLGGENLQYTLIILGAGVVYSILALAGAVLMTASVHTRADKA